MNTENKLYVYDVELDSFLELSEASHAGETADGKTAEGSGASWGGAAS